MKKLLLALLISAGITSAYAQSSVSVYGILDVGYAGTNYKGTGASATTNQTQNFIGQSAEQSSRLGFKGSEDLGGGRSVLFTVETGLNPDNATASTFNNRQSFVGIKQNGLGTVAVGTQYTPVFNAVAASDAGQMNNMIGSVIYAVNLQGAGNPGTAPYANSSSSSGTSDALTVRTSNTITATSEKFYGFGVNGMITANNQSNNATTNGGVTNAQGFGLSADYTWQKLYVTAAFQGLKSQNPGTLTTPTPALWTTASGGVNTQDNQKYIGATYDFGILKAYAQWINRKAVDTINSNYFANRTAQQIGVRGNLASNIDAWASVGNGKVSAFGSNQPTANFVGYQTGANYWLSKRTNLYAIYGQSNTSSVSASAGAISASNYAVGVRHTF
jgi:predicted porin